MQKVKVQRYISGKRPDYARADSSSEVSDEDDFIDTRKRLERHKAERHKMELSRRGGSAEGDERGTGDAQEEDEAEVDDPRLRRLRQRPVDMESRDGQK